MDSEIWNLLNDVRKFIEAEYADPAAAPEGEWLAKEARHIHNKVCTALANGSAFSPAPEAQRMPVITAMFEVTENEIIGNTSAPVKRVEVQDDGSYTVVIDHWPNSQAKTDG